MAAELYEKCLKNALPIQQKMDANMMAIRHLDVQYKIKENDAKQKLTNLVTSWKKLSREDQRRNYEAVEECFAQAKEFCDEKIELASETYELVDGFIQKLDTDTAKFNSFVEQKQQQQKIEEATKSGGAGGRQTPCSSRSVANDATTTTPQNVMSKSGRRGTASSSISTSSVVGKKITASRKRKTHNQQAESEVETLAISEPVIGGDLETAAAIVPAHGDMPVDPNEPRYCTCQQVSFGHMVCCDNKNCLLEWFHFPCVGLTTKPKGKWYCPQCRESKDVSGRPMKREKSMAATLHNNQQSVTRGKKAEKHVEK